MDSDALLALISNLYGQLTECEQKVAEKDEQLGYYHAVFEEMKSKLPEDEVEEAESEAKEEADEEPEASEEVSENGHVPEHVPEHSHA